MKLEDINWQSYCCGGACLYAEIETSSSFLQVKTSHEETDLTYQVRKFGKDKMPLDDDYLDISESDLRELIA
jgi:hypothetical protein